MIVYKWKNALLRFAGEEPTDIVTREYNKTMKRILPEYGIEVVEFPRACLDKNSEEVICATKTRKLVENHGLEKLREEKRDSQYALVNLFVKVSISVY